MENIVKTVILLKDLEYYQQMRAAEPKYCQEYAPRLVSEPPASTCVQPAILARPEFLVEFRRHGGREARVAVANEAGAPLWRLRRAGVRGREGA